MVRKKIKNYLGRDLKRKRSVDWLSGKARSKLMSRIRSKNTVFESDFIKALKKRTSLKFSVNVNTLAGKPDIVFQKQKICVFLDSDFWHGWQYPRWKHLLKNKFWRDKMEKNRARDRKSTLYLRRNGWIVLRIWEHLIKGNGDNQIDKIVKALRGKNNSV